MAHGPHRNRWQAGIDLQAGPCFQIPYEYLYLMKSRRKSLFFSLNSPSPHLKGHLKGTLIKIFIWNTSRANEYR